MRIAVYSGSFDPFHKGHLSIISHLSVLYDKVLLVVSPQNPFKDASKLDNSLERLDSVKRIIDSLKHPNSNTFNYSEELKCLAAKIEVSDIEFSMPAPQYTYRTLDRLRKIYPDAQITLAIGADNLDCIRKWANYEHLLLDYGVIVFPRIGYDYIKLSKEILKENSKYRIELAEMELVNISSTQIREKLLKEGKNKVLEA